MDMDRIRAMLSLGDSQAIRMPSGRPTIVLRSSDRTWAASTSLSVWSTSRDWRGYGPRSAKSGGNRCAVVALL